MSGNRGSRKEVACVELTARELEVADVFIERKTAELHPFADRRQITPERKTERGEGLNGTIGLSLNARQCCTIHLM